MIMEGGEEREREREEGEGGGKAIEEINEERFGSARLEEKEF